MEISSEMIHFLDRIWIIGVAALIRKNEGKI